MGTEDLSTEFKNSAGAWYIQALFYEYGYGNLDIVKFALSFEDKIKDGVTYPGFYQAYLDLEDPTEYLVATKLFGGLDHWDRIANSKVIGPHVQKCREWLALKLRSKGMEKIISQAEESFQAAKYLVDQSWLPRSEKNRLSKANSKVDKKVVSLFEEDMKRILS